MTPLRRRSILALTAITALPSLSGCCTMARFFCGPDRSEWVSKDFRTADAALLTFMEAVRREDTQVIFECLSMRLREEYRLRGVFETSLLWTRLQEEVPGIHLLGTAEVSTLRDEPNEREHVLTVAGYVVHVTLARQAFWEISWRGGEKVRRDGRFVASLAPYFSSLPGEDELMSRCVATLQIDADPVDPPDLERLEVGHEWKVDRLETRPEE